MVLLDTVTDDDELNSVVQLVQSLGLKSVEIARPDVALVLQSSRARAVASLLGASARLRAQLALTPGARVVDAHELRAWALAREQPEDPAALPLVLQCKQWLSRTPVPDENLRRLAHALSDERLVDSHVRVQICNELCAATLPDFEPLSALAAAIGSHRGRLGTHEALALGRLLAKGVQRWPGVEPLCAVEVLDARDGLAPHWLDALKRVGRYERHTDANGALWHRSVLDAPPHVGATRLSPSAKLLQSLGDEPEGHFWIGGVSLPTNVSWTLMAAILGPLATRGLRR
ncbi:MAG: hypothetical protein Q8Q09_11670 [Deltaproteobacteria bacterium]|nr:hypothetical protein [Deltaproteobacteria bacterium]